MRHPSLTLIAIGTFGLLTACGNQDAATAGTDSAVTADDVAAKRAELERLEADLQAQQQADASAAAPAPAPSTASTSRPATSTASRPATQQASRPAASQPSRPAPAPAASPSITVPAGTEVPVTLVTGLSTKDAKVGQAVQARVSSNVTVDGRTAIPAGLTVAGSVVKVVSGSEKIGGTPGIVIGFDRIELPNGDDVAIAGEFEEKGKSDNTRDAVKIVGGAAAGTLLADQVASKRDRNRVIGGILGAAAGAVAARETGTEVKIAEGTALTLVLSAPVEMPRP